MNFDEWIATLNKAIYKSLKFVSEYKVSDDISINVMHKKKTRNKKFIFMQEKRANSKRRLWRFIMYLNYTCYIY